MQHQPDSSAQEQPASSTSASQFLTEHYEFDPATFDARLDAVLAVTPYQVTTGDPEQSLEEVAGEVFREFYGGDGVWGMNSHRMLEDSVMRGVDDGMDVSDYELETQKLVRALHENWSHDQLQEGMNIPVAQEQTEKPIDEPVQEDISSSNDEQELSETQNTQAEQSRSPNPHTESSYIVVDRQFTLALMTKKRKNNEPEVKDATKKHQSEASHALLFTLPPSSPKLSVVQANAGDPQASSADYASPKVLLNADVSRYTSPVEYQNNVQAGPQYEAVSLLHHNAYAPPSPPYSSRPALPYTGYGLASSVPGYVQPSTADYISTSPYPGYAPASSTDPVALQYDQPTLLPPTPAAGKANSPIQGKTRPPGKKPIVDSSFDIPTALQHITRGIQNRTTDVLYQAALDIMQFVHKWHDERDRLEVVMEKKKAEYDETKPNGPHNEKWSPKECEARKNLMSKIRGFEKKLTMVNAELETRGIVVPA